MYVEVALPLPLPRTFTYRVPDELRAGARPGARVLVPFGSKERIGWIDRVAETGGSEKTKAILGVLDPSPSATPSVLRLSRWIAEYYLAPLGLVLRSALPAGLTDATSDFVTLLPGAEPSDELSPLETMVVEWLRGAGEGPLPVARLRRELGAHAWWPAIRRLEERGMVRVDSEGPRVGPPVRTRRVVEIVRRLPSLLER
ncbi:MAG TPA: hypothetical protein VFX98_05985, partial [Longimicrobiaceae bacterium]|nr:hypothetical protein [Longimicrobiaceae bacterium]